MNSVGKGDIVLDTELTPENRDKLISALLRIYRSYTADQLTSLVSRPKPLFLIRNVDGSRAEKFIETLKAQGVSLRFAPVAPDAAPGSAATATASPQAPRPDTPGDQVAAPASPSDEVSEASSSLQPSFSNQFTLEGRSEVSEPVVPSQTAHKDLEKAGRTIAGFWRRLGAFLIDVILLGLAGNILGLVFFEPLSGIGDLGRGIGFVIALLYFGLQNSSIGGGQTVGKRILGIKVVDSSGHLISLTRAHIRAAVLILPNFLNMLQLPFIQMADWAAMAIFVLGSVAVFGLGVGIVYLYLFNTRTRQSVHDLVTGTYVITKRESEVIPKMEILWIHKAVVGCLLAITLLAPFALGMDVGNPGTGLMKLFFDLGQTGKYTYIDIKDSRRLGEGPSFTSLNIVVWLREKPVSLEAAARDTARQVLMGFPEVESRDNMSITVGRGIDIGIGSISSTHTFHQSPMEWRRQMTDDPSSTLGNFNSI